LDHYNSSSSSLKTMTDNSSSRFNFCNENYTATAWRYEDNDCTTITECTLYL